jgi:hypothetical protein
MFGTIGLYITMYSTLHTRLRPQFIALTGNLAPLSPRASEPDTRTTNQASCYMIIYPTIYVLCTIPLAVGRVVALTGQVIPYWSYCIAGAAITPCGWLDVLSMPSPAACLILRTPPPINECGIETFGVFHSPEDFWSVRTVVEGGVGRPYCQHTLQKAQQKSCLQVWLWPL